MKLIAKLAPLLATVALFGCAATVPSTIAKRVDLQDSKRAREASQTIPALVGKYRVVDSRNNRSTVDTAEVTLIAGVPTLRLWRSNGADLTVELQANDCAGDIANKYSQNMFLVCFGTNPHSTKPIYFSMSKVVHPEIAKSGALIPRYEPMAVNSGYLIRYELGDQYGTTVSFAAIKEGGRQ